MVFLRPNVVEAGVQALNVPRAPEPQTGSESSEDDTSFVEDYRAAAPLSESVAPPTIDVWYGPHQVFGHLGNPQQWVNILGNVWDRNGIASLSYSLNGGSESSLSIGPGPSRLVSEGDFNIEIAYTDLISGLNQVRIRAVDNQSKQTIKTVTVEYVAGNVWPETYSIDWSSAAAITEVAQIVDGLWTLEADSIRPVIIGYDRLVNIGDIDPSWDEFEVRVPVTVNEAPPDPNTGGVGIALRWQGHQGTTQPRREWWHMGAYGYYRWRLYGPHLALRLDQDDPIENGDIHLDIGTRYMFKMRVDNTPDQGGLYRLKVWQDGQPEPNEWHLVAQDGPQDLAHGSVLLVAHEVNASFGDVTIVSKTDLTPTLTLHTVGSGAVSVDPPRPQYAYGDVVTLTARPDLGWSFSNWSGDLGDNDNPVTLTLTSSKVVTATFANHPPVLDAIGDLAVASGFTLSFTVTASDPEGSTPSLWADNLPADADFADNGDGTASFIWHPTSNDAGPHVVTFVASDGFHTDSETVTITVNANQIFLPFIFSSGQGSPLTEGLQSQAATVSSTPLFPTQTNPSDLNFERRSKS